MQAAHSNLPLRISFLGFNPLGDGYDGQGLIDVGADYTFASLDSLSAKRLIRRRLEQQRTLDLRITGYSYGGWTALQIVHWLKPWARRVSVRVGLLDPVCTFRPVMPLQVRWWRPPLALPMLDRLALPIPCRGDTYACRPSYVQFARNVFERKGLIVRWNGDGPRMPFLPAWFASQPIEGFENIDVSDEVSEAGGHIEVCDRYAKAVASATFEDVGQTAANCDAG